ncbi:MAG: hypothetical protein RJA29_2743 [Pseudomonadota bacterium]
MDALQDGVNPWLTDPLRWALSMLGVESASVSAVTDADLSGVQRSQVDALLDLAELRALEAVQTNLVSVETWVGEVKEDPSAFTQNLASIIVTKREQIAARYGALLARPLDPSVSAKSARLIAL